MNASLKRLLVRKVISRIPIEYALQIARRKRGAVSICARGYAPQRTFVFKDQRATYVRGDAPFIAQRSGGLTKLFCSQKFCKNKKRQCCPIFPCALIRSVNLYDRLVSRRTDSTLYVQPSFEKDGELMRKFLQFDTEANILLGKKA